MSNVNELIATRDALRADMVTTREEIAQCQAPAASKWAEVEKLQRHAQELQAKAEALAAEATLIEQPKLAHLKNRLAEIARTEAQLNELIKTRQ